MPDNTVVAVAGDAPAWANSLSVPEGFRLQHYPTTERYIAQLTDDRAALVLVDGDHLEWQQFTAAPKASPATRRVPVIVVTTDTTRREMAPTYGADHTLTPAALRADALTLIAQYARIPARAESDQLACECADPLPPLAQAGVEKFNNREFYPQHDLFEEQWMATEGPVRNLYRAILQVGVAYYQVERGNYRGARKMLLRAVQWLEMLPDTCQTIDVAQLRQDAYRVRAELERIAPDEIDQFDRSLLKPLRLVQPQ